MRNTILFFATSAAILLLSCGSTGKIAKSAEKAEIKEIDGSLIISNRDSGGKPFLTDKIIIKNKTDYYNIYKDIKLVVMGTMEDGEKKSVFQAKSYRHKDVFGNVLYNNAIEYLHGDSYNFAAPSYNLSDFTKITFFTTNGKITKSDIKVKNGNLYITIKDYDFTQLSEPLKKTYEKIKEEQRENEKQRQEKIDIIKKEALSKGKLLYEQRILAGQSARNPIIVDSYRIKMDSAGGIEVFISFSNNSGRILKYVDFEVTPYNRVDDIARSTIDGASTKTIQVVDYIEPSKKYDAHFAPVWYNNTISYIKINSIKVTFRDGGTAVIPQKDIATVFKSPELSFRLQNFGDLPLELVYNIPDNRLFIRSDKKYENGGSMLSSLVREYEIELTFETDIQLVELFKNRSPLLSRVDDGHIIREYELDDVLISSARSGYMTEHRPSQMTPRIPALEENDRKSELKKDIFTDEELRQIRDFACIRYYVENMKKGLTADDFATEIPKSGSRIFFVRIDGDGPVIRAEAYRELPESDLRHAIGALLAGPMSSEARIGICSLIPDGTRLLGAGISNGVATLNFSEEFESNQRAGVEGYLAQLMQIVYTATEFDGVKSVQILIDGKKEDYLGEGVWIGSPLSRNLF